MLAGGRQGKSVTPDVSGGVGRPGVQSLPWAFIAGALIGLLGAMISLGGAEFRLLLLIGVFGFVALQAVIMNKAMSLIVVLTALPARLFSVPWSDVAHRTGSSR